MRRACNAGRCFLKCSFHQPVPLVSYLIVLTAGVIEYSAIDARTGVWAEPSLSSAVRTDVVLRGISCCVGYHIMHAAWDDHGHAIFVQQQQPMLCGTMLCGIP